ncbi:MAG: dNTP triphosphohydrolase [Actinomycetia bacterium]|nr:dNTP triphosphohydrolase [Actinomycetes bacterium]
MVELPENRIGGRAGDWREPFDRDYDTVLYSSALRRLKGVTQVTPSTDGLSRSHDRLQHSLKVAQVGQRQGQYCQRQQNRDRLGSVIWPDAIAVAGLCHDLGHPPFGHVAEKELQKVLENSESRWYLSDSFEGNAQTFRILTRLSEKASGVAGAPVGMNLTLGSLAAGMKYPWRKGEAAAAMGDLYDSSYDKKWGFYDSDAAAWDKIKGLVPGGSYRSINADIMDLADDVTYAAHDIHDYFRAGVIPLHAVGRALKTWSRGGKVEGEFEGFHEYAIGSLASKDLIDGDQNACFQKAVEWLCELEFPARSYGDSVGDRRALHEFESGLVRYVQKEVYVSDDVSRLVVPQEIRVGLEYLKELTWYYVINHPSLSASQQGQRRIIRELHEGLCQWADECGRPGTDDGKARRSLRRLPARFQDFLEGADNGDAGISRSAVDFICTLTDAEAVSLHHNLTGTADSVATVRWL